MKNLSTGFWLLGLTASFLLGCESPRNESTQKPPQARVERRNQSTIRENIPDFPDDEIESGKPNPNVPPKQDQKPDKNRPGTDKGEVSSPPKPERGGAKDDPKPPSFPGGEDLVNQLEGVKDNLTRRTAKNFATDIPLAYEQEIGRGVAVILMTEGLVSEPDRLLKYLALVAATLGAVSDRPEVPFYVGLIDSESMNAFAAPGGYLFITRGLLAQIRDEAELAAVLAHEIAHICARHGLSELEAAESRLDAEDAISELDRVFGNERTYDENDLRTLLGDVSNKAYQAARNGYSRDYESEADQKAMRYLLSAGYDPRALIDVLTRVGKLKADPQFLALRSHPDTASRVAALEDWVAKHARRGGVRLADRFQEETGRSDGG